ncbi:flavin-dependent monooxygenase [Endozoicomonas montiporae]|uniref:Flavin-dependent monooxygenase n=2 Tax=Endozoicomonas montiporae TaxID=1027273 RepID=A0A081N874_9GAMM|nr:flavin-dependent monooxygenase [Endozoicomonas montiporae]AMO55465.1 3-hydroxy-9,10-secoandrosta-1,3,5(10)-triene-9,17-dione monooxygenase [Endozoicomonas montiporae CL-33]KEQ14647.1 flavin-dependent monooxygenase [Endozoicomonas montiporae]
MMDKEQIRQELYTKARELVPVLKQRAQEADLQGFLHEETIQDFQDAGFFRILQPAKWEGYELEPKDFFEVQMTVAEGCMSSAWVLGVVAIHNWQLALFDDRAAQDVWADDTSVLISSSYMPVGKVTHVEGGYRLSGKWGFSSGSKHCEWAFLGAIVPPKNEGEAPDYRTFLVPRSDYEIQDNWDVMGLRATGSNDIVVDDVFVPEYRTHRSLDGFMQSSPGNEVNTAPLFKLPFGQIFVRSVSSSAIGALKGAVDEYIEFNRNRIVLSDGKAVREDPGAQKAAADALRVVDECKTTLFKNFDILVNKAESDVALDMEERVKMRYDSAYVMTKCAEAVNQLYTFCGSSVIFKNHTVNRAFRDIQTGRTHVANVPDKYGRNFGGVVFGRESTDFFL